LYNKACSPIDTILVLFFKRKKKGKEKWKENGKKGRNKKIIIK